MSTYKGRWYVGVPHDRTDIAFAFQSLDVPTTESHGHLYLYCWGPFKTLRRAVHQSYSLNRIIYNARTGRAP
jgi:hypothetical protein